MTAAVGPAAAAVLDVVQLGLRATAISVFVLVQNLFGLAIGPVLAGAIADRWGLTSALGAVAGLGVAAALALYAGSRAYGRDRNQAASLPAPGLPGGAAPRSGATEPAGPLDGDGGDAAGRPITVGQPPPSVEGRADEGERVDWPGRGRQGG